MEAGNTITFYLDPKIDNSFMNNVANDLQCVTQKEIRTISTQVNKVRSAAWWWWW